MINKNEYLLDEILKVVDRLANDKSDDAVVEATDSLNAKLAEHSETLGELQEGVANVEIQLDEIKEVLQQIVDIVLKQIVDNAAKTDKEVINRTRKPISAYGDTTDKL